MVLRIRDLLYEEKFTIAGAKKKLSDEMRGTSSKPSRRSQSNRSAAGSATETQQAPASRVEDAPPIELQEPDRVETENENSALSPKARRAVSAIKRELEALLTLLNSDASIQR
jgi:hypothetical protein